MVDLKNRYLVVPCVLGIAYITGCDKAVDESGDRGAAKRRLKFSNSSDPNLREMIARTFEALKARDDAHVERFYRELTNLRKAADSDHEELVNQLVKFAAGLTGVDALRVRLILDRLEIPDRPIIRALAPHLGATNPVLRSFARDWFLYHDNSSSWGPDKPLEPLNFAEYGAYIRNRVRKKQPVPEEFVKYIYSRMPSHALLAFYYAHEGRPLKNRDLLWSEHVIGNAIWMKENGFDEAFEKAKPEALEHLQQLSKHEQWWVRLYVARIISYPGLENDAIHEQLRKDENDLVRHAIAETKEKLNRRLSPDGGPAQNGAGHARPSTGVRVIRGERSKSPPNP